MIPKNWRLRADRTQHHSLIRKLADFSGEIMRKIEYRIK